jgi:integrase
MSSINFYIDKPNRKNECPIYMVYENNGDKFKYFTKQKIKSSLWSQKSQKVKSGSAAEDINIHLADCREIIRQIERKALLNFSQVSANEIKEQLINTLHPPKPAERDINRLSEFHTYFNQYIEASKATKVHGTVKQIKATFEKLKAFEIYCNYTLTFESINLEFYQKFQEYLINDLELLNNSIGKQIKTLKSFLNYCTERGYNTNTTYMKFKAVKEDIEIIYLTETELLNLFHLDIAAELLKISGDPKKMQEINPNNISAGSLGKVRDLFCFACFTGLRYSDISTLQPDQIKKDHLLIRTTKTKDILTIPLVKYAVEILERHFKDGNNALPRIITNQKMNEYIKIACRLAEINEMTRTVSYSGSKKIEALQPKYELISFHTARRTFITLALEKGMRAEVIMEISGHKDYKTFKKYIKITDKVKKDELNRIWS